MSKVLNKFLKRCRKMFSTTKLRDLVVTTIDTPTAKATNNSYQGIVRDNVSILRSSLKNHLAATKIQSAYRRYMNSRNTNGRLCRIDANSNTTDCNKSGILMEASTLSRVKVATTSASPSSLEKSMELKPGYGHLGKNGRNLQRLLKFHTRLLRSLHSVVRVTPQIDDRLIVGSLKNKIPNADHEYETPADTTPKVDMSWKLHLEPKSRNKTLQRYLPHVSILDCYGLGSSTSDFSPRRRSGVDVAGLVPVYLNVYDIIPINSCLYWLGLGAHHSGVQVNGVEYAFGTDEFGTAGIFKTEPKESEDFTFRKTILIGWTRLGEKDVREVIHEIAARYREDDYSLITRNCNHFSTEACIRLTGNTIPLWVNRLARFGSVFVQSTRTLRRKRIRHCNSSASSSSLCSDVTVTGKSSRWKKSVLPSLSLDWVL